MRKTLRALACASTALSATGLAITGLAAGSAGAATSASAAPASAAAIQPGPWAQASYNAADSNANLGETSSASPAG